MTILAPPKTFPLGCFVRRSCAECGNYPLYRVVGYCEEHGTLALIVVRADGYPCYWSSARTPVMRDLVKAALVGIVE